jgi:hypothetical protein
LTEKAKKRRWGVTMPITGTVYIEVKAATAREAIRAAFNAKWDPDNVQWEMCEQVVEGNVFHGEQNEAEAEEIDSE